MTDTHDLMQDHRILKERVPGSAIQTSDVLYLRGDKVVKILQGHNTHLQEISDRLSKVVARHKAQKERIVAARQEVGMLACSCRYLGEGDVMQCRRCCILDLLKEEP